MPCSTCNCPFQTIRSDGRSFAALQMECLLEDAVQHVTFAEGEALFIQGQASSSLFAVSDGMVKICTHSPDGREQIVGLSCQERLLVGLQSISDSRYAYTAIAATGVSACKIHHRTLLARVRESGELTLRLIEAINAQLAHSRAMMEVMGRKSAAAKIAAFILHMTPRSGNGACRFALPFSRMEIAGILGLSEETVCRLMANMKRAGAIYAPRGRVEIRDWARLQAIAEGRDRLGLKLVG